MKIDIFHKGLLSFAFVVLCGAGAMAQLKVGDNPTTLNQSAMLEVESTNRGLLLPRLSLSSTSSALMGTPTRTAVAGMTVYNTNAGITGSATYPANGAGMYYFDGTGWIFGGFPTGGTTGQVLSKNAANNGLSWNDATPGILRYSIGSATGAGAIVKATGTGVTFAVNTTTQTATITVPSGVELISVRMFENSATPATSSYGMNTGAATLNITYVLQAAGVATSYATTVLPQLQTVLDGFPTKYMDAVGNATNARKYVLAAAPSGGTYTISVPQMDPTTLGNAKWTVLMNF